MERSHIYAVIVGFFFSELHFKKTYGMEVHSGENSYLSTHCLSRQVYLREKPCLCNFRFYKGLTTSVQSL